MIVLRVVDFQAQTYVGKLVLSRTMAV